MTTTHRDRVAALLIAVAAVPFASHWLDFEVARRGVALLIGGGLAVFAGRAWPSRVPRGWIPLTAVFVFAIARSIGTTNPTEGLFRAAYYGALAMAFVVGGSFDATRLARAALPTLGIVAAYGVAQAAGLEWPSGYARAQAVSTLGNRNVASEFVAIALATCVATARRPGLVASSTMLLAALYLGLNGSRSGVVAIGLVTIISAVIIAKSRADDRRTVAALGAVLAALAIGWFAGPIAAIDPPPGKPESEVATAPPAAPSTLAVRAEIWRSSWPMVQAAPWLGHGTGQFRYEFPRYRSAEEIDLSTFGRRFRTFVPDPHNDHLLVLVEGGGIGFALWLAFWISIAWPHARTARGLILLGPVAVFCAVACVRAPLGNGPAALLAFAWAGAIGRRDATAARARSNAARFGLLVMGVAGAFVGGSVLLAQCSHAAAANASSEHRPQDLARLALATTAHPSESRYRSQRIRAIRASAASPSAAFEAAREDVEQLLGTDPNNPTALFLVAELAHHAGHDAMTDTLLARILTIDPVDTQATLLVATRACLAGDAPRGAAVLYSNPHPRVREQIAGFLDALTAALRTRGDDDSARFLEREARFVRGLDSIVADPTATDVIDFEHVPDRLDGRLRALYARQALARGERSAADALAPASFAVNRSVRRMLEPVLQDLRELPRWRAVLEQQ